MSRPRRPFTAEEDAYIVAHYGTRTLKAMAAQLARSSWAAVQYRVRILARRGLLDVRERAYHRPWTMAERDWLADNWGLHADEYCARYLRRSVNACKIRATRALGLARTSNFYTARAVAGIFGIDEKVVRRWIGAGCLKAKRSTVRAGDGHWMWRIDDEAITAFIEQFPWHYNRRRIERQSWWRNLADKVWATDPWLTVPEAAAALSVCTRTVSRHVQRGWLRAEHTWQGGASDGGYRIPRSALAGFRLRQPVRPASEKMRAWYERGAAASGHLGKVRKGTRAWETTQA